MVCRMHDSMPVEVKTRVSNSFGAEIMDIPDVGECIVGGGAGNSRIHWSVGSTCSTAGRS